VQRSKLPKAKTPREQEFLQRQIAATDRSIDALVYELYGLAEAEIRIVEGRNAGQESQHSGCGYENRK
jgi:hypothetical protein